MSDVRYLLRAYMSKTTRDLFKKIHVERSHEVGVQFTRTITFVCFRVIAIFTFQD